MKTKKIGLMMAAMVAAGYSQVGLGQAIKEREQFGISIADKISFGFNDGTCAQGYRRIGSEPNRDYSIEGSGGLKLGRCWKSSCPPSGRTRLGILVRHCSSINTTGSLWSDACFEKLMGRLNGVKLNYD
jgi:hypothetical protein